MHSYMRRWLKITFRIFRINRVINSNQTHYLEQQWGGLHGCEIRCEEPLQILEISCLQCKCTCSFGEGSSQPLLSSSWTSSATATLASRRDRAVPVPPSQSVTRGPQLISQSTTDNSHDFLVILKDHWKLGDNRMLKSIVTYNTALLPKTKGLLESLPLSSSVSPWEAPYPDLLLPSWKRSRQHREPPV